MKRGARLRRIDSAGAARCHGGDEARRQDPQERPRQDRPQGWLPRGASPERREVTLLVRFGLAGALVGGCVHSRPTDPSPALRVGPTPSGPAEPRCRAGDVLAGPEVGRRDEGGRVVVQHGGASYGPAVLSASGAYMAAWAWTGVQVHDIASGREIFATPPVAANAWGWSEDRIFALERAPEAGWLVSTWNVLEGEGSIVRAPLPAMVAGDASTQPEVVARAGLVLARIFTGPDRRGGGPCAGEPQISSIAWHRVRDRTSGELHPPSVLCASGVPAIHWSADGTWMTRPERWPSQLMDLASGQEFAELPPGARVLTVGRAVVVAAMEGGVYALDVGPNGLGAPRLLVTGPHDAAVVGPGDRGVAMVAKDVLRVLPPADGGATFERTLPPGSRLVAPLAGGCGALVLAEDQRIGMLGERPEDDRWVGAPRGDLLVDWHPTTGALRGPKEGERLDEPTPVLAALARPVTLSRTPEAVTVTSGAGDVRTWEWPVPPVRGAYEAHAATLDPSGRFIASLTFFGHRSSMVATPPGRPPPAVLAVRRVDGTAVWSRELRLEPTALAVTEDAVLVAGGPRPRLRWYSLVDGREEVRPDAPSMPGGALVSLAVSADGTRLAGVTNDPSHLVIWDARGRMIAGVDLKDARRPRYSASPYRFRDLNQSSLALSGDGALVSWTDPFSLERPGYDVIDLVATDLAPLNTSLYRIEASRIEQVGRHAWVRFTADAVLAGDPDGRVSARDPRTLATTWQLQIYPNGAWVRWSGSRVEASPRAGQTVSRVDERGVRDLLRTGGDGVRAR